MNFGFHWNAVPQWLWYVMIGTLGALIMLAVDIFVLGRWRKGQTSAKIQEYESRIASFADERAKLTASLDQAEAGDLKVKMVGLQGELDDDDEERDALKAEIARLNAQLTERATLAASAPVAFATAAGRGAEDATPYTMSCPQHLSDVKGVGTIYEGRLCAAGIGTYWELAQTPKDKLISILGVTDLQRERFDYEVLIGDAIRLAGETATKGRAWDAHQPDDFEPIDGLGYTYEKRLYDSGVCTYASLVETSDAQLEENCHPPKLRIPDYASWRAQARQLMAAK